MKYLVIKGNYQAYANSVKDAISTIKTELINNMEAKLINSPYYRVYDVSELDDDTEITIYDEYITYYLNNKIIVDDTMYLTHIEAIELELPA